MTSDSSSSTVAGLSVTILGASGSYAGPGGACTGLLVRSPAANVWLDAGPGTLANLQEHVGLRELSAIVLTHEHPDHWLELPVVYAAVRHYEHRKPVPVYGTAGTLALAETMCPALPEAFDWRLIEDRDTASIGDQEWHWSRTDHYVETMASRVDVGESSFVFTADTGPKWDITQLGTGFDLLVSESTFLSSNEPEGILHLSARQAGSIASEAGARRLILSHLAPGEEPAAHAAEAEAAYGAPVDIAAIGQVYSV
ncbi:MAG: MBL fold metallo-hydrolase [Acidimicrobiales bacterium]